MAREKDNNSYVREACSHDIGQDSSVEEAVCVCYCGNSRVFGGLLLSALSLARQTSARLRVIVLSMSLPEVDESYVCFSENQLSILNGALRRYNPESSAEQIDVTALYRQHLLHGINENCGYTPYSMIRLFLDLLPGIPDKLVYLDVDTMATSDILQLYNTDVTDYEYGAVPDYMGTFWISAEYCNSGVLLLNMNMIRQTGLFEKCRKNVLRRKMIMPDQTSLNRLAVAKLYLPRKFNEQRDKKADTVIKHFCKGIRYFPFFHIYNVKQWERERVRRVLKVDWLEDTYKEYDEITSHCDINS